MTEGRKARFRVPAFIIRHKRALETFVEAVGINVALRIAVIIIGTGVASAAVATVATHESAASSASATQLKELQAMRDALADVPPAPSLIVTDLTQLAPNQRVERKLLLHPPTRFKAAKTRLTLRNTTARCSQLATSSSFACTLTHAGVKTYKATLDGPRR